MINHNKKGDFEKQFQKVNSKRATNFLTPIASKRLMMTEYCAPLPVDLQDGLLLPAELGGPSAGLHGVTEYTHGQHQPT